MYSLKILFYLAIKLWENLCNKQDLVCPVTVKDKKKSIKIYDFYVQYGSLMQNDSFTGVFNIWQQVGNVEVFVVSINTTNQIRYLYKFQSWWWCLGLVSTLVCIYICTNIHYIYVYIYTQSHLYICIYM